MEPKMNEDRKLTGKVAIVFGGSRGIGAAAARRLAREGANVGLTYVSAPDKAADTVRAIEEEGRTGFAIKADPAWGPPPGAGKAKCRSSSTARARASHPLCHFGSTPSR